MSELTSEQKYQLIRFGINILSAIIVTLGFGVLLFFSGKDLSLDTIATLVMIGAGLGLPSATKFAMKKPSGLTIIGLLIAASLSFGAVSCSGVTDQNNRLIGSCINAVLECSQQIVESCLGDAGTDNDCDTEIDNDK